MNNLISLFFQLFRFGTVGVCAASIHFATVIFLVQFGHLLPLVANVVAFLVSFQVSYWGHRLWTFQGTATLHREAFPRLLLVQITSFAINEYLFYLLLAIYLPYQMALLIVLAIMPCFTFILSKLWVFR